MSDVLDFMEQQYQTLTAVAGNNHAKRERKANQKQVTSAYSQILKYNPLLFWVRLKKNNDWLTVDFKKQYDRLLVFGSLQLLNESPRRKRVTPRDLHVPAVTQPFAAKKLTPTTPSVQQLISFATPRATAAAGDADSVAEFIASENVQPSTSAASVSVVSTSSLAVPSIPIPPVIRRSGPPDIATIGTRP
ncbi:GL20667 [Drosophila persimilis]|uniref:GL20667 n=1 Tax=Drosophila persimilis TaxID=7234 RepID=B4HC71_DROPE|nr:GL20667 [Drosophila persimilis]